MPQSLCQKLTNVFNKLYLVILNLKENSTPFHEAIYMAHMTPKYQLVIRILPLPCETSSDNADLRTTSNTVPYL